MADQRSPFGRCGCLPIVAGILLLADGTCVSVVTTACLIQSGCLPLQGAVAHVLVNDPTRGYAVFAETMLETAQSVTKNNSLKEVS